MSELAEAHITDIIDTAYVHVGYVCLCGGKQVDTPTQSEWIHPGLNFCIGPDVHETVMKKQSVHLKHILRWKIY